MSFNRTSCGPDGPGGRSVRFFAAGLVLHHAQVRERPIYFFLLYIIDGIQGDHAFIKALNPIFKLLLQVSCDNILLLAPNLFVMLDASSFAVDAGKI